MKINNFFRSKNPYADPPIKKQGENKNAKNKKGFFSLLKKSHSKDHISQEQQITPLSSDSSSLPLNISPDLNSIYEKRINILLALGRGDEASLASVLYKISKLNIIEKNFIINACTTISEGEKNGDDLKEIVSIIKKSMPGNVNNIFDEILKYAPLLNSGVRMANLSLLFPS